MLHIKVFGSGCPNCKRLESEVRAALDEIQLAYELEKVTEYEDIMTYGVMHTPALVINDKLVSSGRIPKRKQILEWAQSDNQAD